MVLQNINGFASILKLNCFSFLWNDNLSYEIFLFSNSFF